MNFRSLRGDDTFAEIAPHSRMVFPTSLHDRLKYFFWRLYSPIHPFLRFLAVGLGVIRHNVRQNYYLGKIAPGQSFEELVEHLVAQGYGNHFVAWNDPDELISLRHVENFMYQYHIRIFKDGEVRGHYEYTPEYRPILHLRKVGQEDRKEDFLKILGDRIV